MRFLFVLADRLHKSVGEIRAFPADELAYWLAYLNLEQRELGKAGR